MFIAYVDETGDTGSLTKSGASQCYALGCVLVNLDAWPDAFDGIIEFRRRVRGTFGLPMRAEVKANYLIRSSGPLRKIGLPPAQRNVIYRAHLRTLNDLGARAFAVVVDKRRENRSPSDTFHVAWEALLNRLERTSTYESSPFMIIHDEGENDAVRRVGRKARRHLTAGRRYGGGSFTLPAKALIDDPVPRTSKNSYFIQMADLVAYAGWRAYMPPSTSVAAVAPGDIWGDLGNAIHRDVNRISGGTPGVVLR